ncbi:MAG: bifunctional DNA-formamidopyrimidine glycosylase/DNA-(apurinic or apyrimidinic site) lyase [Acidimicrobiia bacterium]|nr:bifunctional DNA-formamidopyrimidine glycosylase/DNA-(apurinic or apyrimidinic site) lyase [Acidimicrobiia bacterium]
MPELPEVETVRRALEPVLTGARITGLDVRRERMVRRQPNPADVAARLVGRRVSQVGRHGKFLQLDLDDGEFVWVLHLGMSGRLTFDDDGAEPLHTNVVVRHDGGPDLWFVDPRTFGFMAVFTPEELAVSTIGALGPDALWELPESRALGEQLDGRSASIKSLLLDQRIVAGLGNIYADEVLHRSHIHPRRAGGSLDASELTALRRNVRLVLEAGIASGGTSLNDLAYLLPDGRAGQFLMKLRAYGREGGPCRTCGTPIERLVIAQRSSFFCPRCQT